MHPGIGMSVHRMAQRRGVYDCLKKYLESTVMKNGTFLDSLIHPRVAPCDVHSYQFQGAFSDANCSF